MSDILSLINDVVFVSLVNTTLQMTLLVSLIALVIWVFRVKSAATRYFLWLFVIFALIVLPLLTPFIPQMDFARSNRPGTAGERPDHRMQKEIGASDVGALSADSSRPSMGATRVAANKEADVSLINPVSIAYFTWCAGAFFMLCITMGAYRNLKKLKTSSPDVESPAALEMLSRLKQKIGIEKSVALKTSPDIYTPISLGIFSPAVILPNDVADGGSSSELEMILTHELAHIKRRDYLINIFQNMLRAIFFFHPLFYLMNRNLAKAREHICDDWVIDVTQQRSGYAECIIGLLEKALYKPVSVPVTLAMAERKRDIPGRIDMIVDNRRKTNTKVSGKALIAVFLIGCFCVPVIGGIGLVRFAGARPASHEGRIVFEKRDQNWNSSVWVMDANGENEKRLSDSGSDPAWSPDGRQIAFHIWNDGANDIWVMNADGANIKRLTNSPMLELDFGATWSPDGKQVAFTRSFWEEEEFKSSAICVVNADGTNERTLVKEKLIELRDLSWSPDGKKIVFARVQVWEGSIWVMDADGENEKKLAENGFEPCWSPDGGMIAFESSSGIFVMDADGGRQERLTPERDAWDDQHPTWSPDGTKIAFCSYERDKPSEMYVMNADGSNVQQLTNTPEYEFQPDWTAFSYAVEPAGKLKSTWGEIKRGLFGK